LVKGAYLATFRPVTGFAPRTPGQFLARFSQHSSLRSEPTALGGASFFRTRAKDGVLIGSFLTAYPDRMREDIAAMPFLELISIQELTPEMFVQHEASAQESLGTTKKGFSAGNGEFPQDVKLSESQRKYRNWTEERFFAGQPAASQWKNLAPREKAAAEERMLKQLSSDNQGERISAINALADMRSKKAVPDLLKIAAERVEKDNRDRWMAVRALGIIGDPSAVPDLVHLTYHYNINTRFWAQISLVRLTGENFGRDVNAWRRWWQQQGKTPTIAEETVAWATSAEAIKWSDPKKMDEMDRQFSARADKAMKPGGQPAASAAPQIVGTSPPVGATDVDPATSEITVTFDRDMEEGFSWTGGGPEYPPLPNGKNAFWRDRRTCVLPVMLEHGRYYRVGIQADSYQNFRSAAGVPARPSAIYFITQGASEEVKNRLRKPTIVSMNPPNGAKNVDPALRELRVTFNVPMGAGFSWCGGGPGYPKTIDRPYWTEDRKTCVLPVELKPAWVYRLGLNSVSFNNFQSEGGIPLTPVEYMFYTRGTAPLDHRGNSLVAQMPKSEAEKKAVEAAEAWLALVDKGQYEQSWDAAAEYLKNAADKSAFVKSLEASRRPLGTVKSRQLKSTQYATTLPGAPDGQYVILQYTTSMAEKQAATETITPMLDKDKKWRVSGYYIK
jgi:hypothetical protein